MKQIMIQVNQFVPDDATDFQKETDFVLKKSNYLNLETGISWHLKCCESISIFFTKIVDLRTVLLNSDVLKHLKPRSVCRLRAKYRLYLSCFDVFLVKMIWRENTIPIQQPSFSSIIAIKNCGCD